MAGDLELARGPLTQPRDDLLGALVATALLWLAGLPFLGSGFQNGDAAAYTAQGWAADLGQRQVHLVYVAWCALLAPLVGDDLPYALDLTNLACACVFAFALSRAAPGPAWRVIAGAATALWPIAWSAEVDAPWMALVGVATVVSRRWVALPVALAVGVSPVALLALPWLLWVRSWREPALDAGWRIAEGAAFAMLALTVVSLGDWWVGDRGVLSGAGAIDVRRNAFETILWLAHPGIATLTFVAVVPAKRAVLVPGLLATTPLWLAPADVPVWVLPVATLWLAAQAKAPGATDVIGAPTWLMLLALAAMGSMMRGSRMVIRVQADDLVLHDTVSRMGPDDGLVASWSWGARASVIATRDPYALPWRVPGEPVRDQAERWCNASFHEVWVLPPGEILPGATAWRVDDATRAIVVDGADPAIGSMPGCR